jgi:cation diffusion facilitator CzcD-associated flavoprotein CzcO
MTVPAPRHVRHAIIGTGFGGLGAAIRLQEDLGERDVVLFERHAGVGGTWWANTYPGAGCDIPSHLYSFSFAPNPEWTRTYPRQQEILDYLRDVTRRFGLADRIRFDTTVTSLSWDEAAGRWTVETTQGTWTADYVIAAAGPLSEPALPALEGLDRFAGTMFHTARWDHDHDLAGRRVAVIGTGASAIQVVPEIAPLVEHLDVFQRTPPWVVAHGDRPIRPSERTLYRHLPIAQRIVRSAVYAMREMLVPGLVKRPPLLAIPERLARKHLAHQVPDPELRRRLTPDYRIGCKRILPSNRWYPAIQRDNVTLQTEAIAAVEADAIVTADGARHPVDTIVLATGFHVTDVPLAPFVTGTGGRSLRDVWGASPHMYRGTAVPGFPNLFFLVGPNVGLGHNSIVFMIEAQLNYLVDALRQVRERGLRRVEVRPEVERAYNAELQGRLRRSVWNTGGCASWYLDATGRNSTLWPGFTFDFWRRTRRFDLEAYAVAPAG